MKKELTAELIEEAHFRLKGVASYSPLQLNKRLSEKYKAKVYLKREDFQYVRSYKIRGAYNKIAQLSKDEKAKGVVCASAGNHAQGVAFSCEKLKVKGRIYMPVRTPKQKVERVKVLGGNWVEIELVGETFDESYEYAKKYCSAKNKTFVHPFDDVDVMAGQGTVGLEILGQLEKTPDYIFVPVGGGGLLAGLGTYVSSKSFKTKVVGVEPVGAPSMSESLKLGKVVTLEKLDKFVDGASVKTVGLQTFQIAKKVLDKMLHVPEGKVCEDMIALYQSDGIIAEPAGALSVSGLEDLKKDIKSKTVVCVVSGGNNDLSRYSEIVDRSLTYQGLKHYFIVDFPQVPGTLRNFLDSALGKNDDIVLFEYMKKNNKETGPALVGIELSNKKDLKSLLKRMNKIGLSYETLERGSPLFSFVL